MSRWLEQLADYGGSPRTLRIIGAVLTTLLLALAVLQYHWIGQLTEAKKSEMQQALQASATRFSYDFNRELSRMYTSLLAGRPWSTPSPGDTEGALERYAERYRQWSAVASHVKMLKRLYVAKDANDLYLLEPENLEWEPATWPAAWSDLRADMRRLAERYGNGPRPPRGERPGGPGPGGGGGPGGGPRPFSGAFETLPILAAMRFERDLEGEPRPAGWVIAELDFDYIKNEMLPEMAQRHFSDNYQILVTNRAESPQAIFAKGDAKSFGVPDYEGGLFEIQNLDGGRGGRRFGNGGGGPPRREPGGGGGGGPMMGKGEEPHHRRRPDEVAGGPPLPPPPPNREAGGSGPASSPEGRPTGGGPGGGGPGGGPGGGMFGFGGPGPGRWTLQVKHTAGSLDRAVQTLRYRNLGISFAILLFMGITIGAFVDSTRRARQLALQQMEFVASISHELRTPLTVICSAGDNLAGGVVKNDSQVKRYGNLIRSEGRRLADMVEQILGYAGIQKGRLPAPQAIYVEPVIEGALRACSQALDSSGTTVERDIAEGLPQISGDSASLSHSIQNLVTNAAKYGGDWVRISARLAAEGKRIAISVEDRGPGIEPKELRHIFEPFYRGRKAVDDQIHGTGLGLSLVKRIVEAHSGRVFAESTPGKGSCFTIELPVIARAEAAAEHPAPGAGALERNNEATSTLG